MKKVLWMIFMTFMVLNVNAQKPISSDEVITSNIQYKNGKDTYIKERCKLDIYYDRSKKNLPVVVWYHGGGLTSGQKEIPELLKKQGFVVVGVNYRLLPKVKIDECLDDCAASLAWVFQNISQYGGDTKKIFVSGHSAGGYITTMLGLDKTWLSRSFISYNKKSSDSAESDDFLYKPLYNDFSYPLFCTNFLFNSIHFLGIGKTVV